MDWSAYNDWNDALASVVFSPSSAGQPVYLDLEEDSLQQAAGLLGASGDARQGLIDAVRATIDPSDPTESLRSHLRRLQRWARTTGGEPPPIIGLLAVLSLAAEDMQASDGIAANNYYDRLMPLLGIRAEHKNRVISWYHSHSFDLWESLNGWLEDLRGERGLPTAYSYSHAHVGRPLSQALMRAADRARLEELFLDSGLEPRSNVSPHDMEAMLSEWIAQEGSAASHHMRMLWGASQERMTEIACQLLETWEPSAEVLAQRHRSEAKSGSSGGIRLLALSRAFPPSIEIDVVGSAATSEVRVIGRTDDGEPASIAVEVVPLGDGRWRLGRPDLIDHASILEGVLELEVDAETRFLRRPRRVVPLRQDGLLRSFVEVERLGLGEDGRLLARSDLASVLEDALSQVARPGFRRTEPRGLPPGWCAFEDVQIVLSLLSVKPTSVAAWPLDLQVLQPISSVQTTLAGGLQLPGRLRRWSSLAPPELRIVAEGATSIDVTVDRVSVFRAEERVHEEGFAGTVAMLDLGELLLPDGDYQITTKVTSNGKKLRASGSTRVRLRSADSPAPAGDVPTLHHQPLDGHGVLSATEATSDAPEGIRGLSAPPHGTWAEPPPPPTGPPLWWAARRSAPASAVSTSATHLQLARATPTDCFNTGAHHFVLPTWAGGRSSGSFEGACKYCGLVKRFPARYRAKRKRALKELFPPTFVSDHIPPIASDHVVDIRSAFDALCHDGSGPAAWLEQIGLQVEASSLYIDSMTRALEALGHLEVHRSATNLVPMDWQIAPTALARSSGGFVLVGHRGRSLVSALEAVADEMEVRLTLRPNGSEAPPRIRLEIAEVEGAEQAALEVMDKTGLSVQVLDDPTRGLLAALPPLSAVAASRPRVSLATARSARRWDPKACRWEPCHDAHSTGVFQLLGARPLYCSRDQQDLEQGTMTPLDARLAKHVAALRHGAGLAGYDPETRVLYVPLGADLPGLYGRAAVSASGCLPNPDKGQGTLAYGSIDPEVAGHLHHLLTT